ncbi:MAG TPA: ABC transporter substrate-binding protein [Methylomusa anaerophila]|uniref:Leucine-, isoleucine-, valine-, threonine-, and alanine-binding protein n=1 Tax=Methylomusa anaerophila TaxID=1930071 RepID=A0A348AHQ1_9FIRM|nr:ABC transporter substrate-binding protein [Methylomusa anaerophila]BBB90599.1 leucine-, isoleucine-, valine-, threonine-, and alanine-binding protein precursor [Methylomusa anaerophila]HML88794.1 ABC transporter substrate-binding protein [Methylomusa anaerophila]
MSKKWHSFIGLAVILTMVAGLIAGCGGSGAPAADSKDIKVGANFELTGNVANFGQQTLNGVKLAVKEANAAGGVLGKQLTLVTADNKSEPAEATNAITKLITQDKVVAVLGPVTSSDVLATLQVGQDNKIPVLTATATNPKITVDNGKIRPYAFRACFIDPFQGKVMADFATKTIKAKTAAIYIDNSSDYSKGLAEVFEKSFTAAGGKIVAKEGFLQKDADFKATLTKIKATNPETIFIPAYYEEVGKIIKQARELGIDIPLLGTDGWDDSKIVDIAGAAPLNNGFFSNHYSSQDKDPNIQKFVEAYKKEYNQEPSALAALGYDSALMLIDAIKRAGSADPQKIRDALEQTKNLQVSTGILTLDAEHNPVKSAVVIEMKDGKQVFKEKINP